MSDTGPATVRISALYIISRATEVERHARGLGLPGFDTVPAITNALEAIRTDEQGDTATALTLLNGCDTTLATLESHLAKWA